MDKFRMFAQPWWVNLLILVPAAVYFLWRRKGLELSWRQILTLSAFGLAFGFVEAAVVAYLQAAAGHLSGSSAGTLADFRRWSMTHQQTQSINEVLPALMRIEVMREAATMVMLVCVAMLAGSGVRGRWAAFLWAFAVWDIAYYAGLWATVGWPSSLKDLDVLFLIPVPWVAQVWYPLLVSTLTLLALVSAKMRRRV
jgi:hypothetical protein